MATTEVTNESKLADEKRDDEVRSRGNRTALEQKLIAMTA